MPRVDELDLAPPLRALALVTTQKYVEIPVL
jgi:hypothetical protein